MEECIFCKVIKAEIPANIVYEDSSFLAFLDINPVSDGHLLLIPKEHIVWMQDADDKTIEEIFKLTKKLMKTLKAAMKCDYVLISIVGKDVPHFHIHLIPRNLDDGLAQFPTKKHKDGQAEEIKEKIVDAL